MKRIRRKPTRARRAVRAAAAMLCAVGLYLLITDAKLTPMMAVHTSEEYYGIYEDTSAVASCTGEDGRRFYLMAGENVLLCASCSPYGPFWVEQYGTVLDCSDGESIHAGWQSRSSYQSGQWNELMLFGRIDDESIASVQILRQRKDKWDEETGSFVFETRCVYPVDELIENGGHRYFLAGYLLDGQPRSSQGYDRFVLVGYSSTGGIVAEYEIKAFAFES